jgi:hypothetical protein
MFKPFAVGGAVALGAGHPLGSHADPNCHRD